MLIQIQDKLWVSQEKIVFKRISSCGIFTEITCNAEALANRYYFGDDNWTIVENKYINNLL